MNEIDPVNNADIEKIDGSTELVDMKEPKRVLQRASKIWNNVHLWRVVTIAVVIALGAHFAYLQPVRDAYEISDPDTNGFVEPRDMGAIIEKLDKSVVTIYCEAEDKETYFGTAWSFEYPGILNRGKYALMTNHHVIEDCINGGRITLEDYWGDEFEAKLEKFDDVNDLAVVSTNHKLPTLKLASYPPVPGYWVLAYGSADQYSGSVATGNIINLDEYGDLLISANISGGNSGGPLIDNEGNVFGVNTWSANSEKYNTQYNVSVSLDSFCDRILDCNGDTFWDWD